MGIALSRMWFPVKKKVGMVNVVTYGKKSFFVHLYKENNLFEV